MKHFAILIITLLGLFSTMAFSADSESETGGGHFIPLEDTLPWPWGTECPFPWKDIEGLWKMSSRTEKSFFEFRVLSQLEDGSRLFEVTHLNENFEIIAEGRGLAPAGKRIVRAAMHSPESFKGKPYSYWAILRSYVKKDSYGCSEDDLVTAVTFRPIDQAEGVDHHYVLEKLESY